MGVKSSYTDEKNKIIKQLIVARNIKAIRDLKKDRKSYKKYSSGWLKVNLDDFMSKFSSKSEIYDMESGLRKISFYSAGKEYEIVCAIGASYFRIMTKVTYDSKGKKQGGRYVDIHLKEPKVGHLKGKAAKEERERLTHFKMTYKHTDV